MGTLMFVNIIGRSHVKEFAERLGCTHYLTLLFKQIVKSFDYQSSSGGIAASVYSS